MIPLVIGPRVLWTGFFGVALLGVWAGILTSAAEALNTSELLAARPAPYMQAEPPEPVQVLADADQLDRPYDKIDVDNLQGCSMPEDPLLLRVLSAARSTRVTWSISHEGTASFISYSNEKGPPYFRLGRRN
jgi:hypothetical protein